jgi:nucleoside-diphosphate-sugar epimerase
VLAIERKVRPAHPRKKSIFSAGYEIMVRILITGAGGFLGKRLTRALVEAGSLACGKVHEKISRITLADRAPVEPKFRSDIEFETFEGDLGDETHVEALCRRNFDSIFHLAAVLPLDAEKDQEKSYWTNVGALRHIMARISGRPRIVFTSSLAVFGGELPERVDDGVVQRPATTYGVHKSISELLIADYTRHGRIDGRTLRLPIVLIRPGFVGPTPSVADRVASILREPLQGSDVIAPLAPDTLVPLASVGSVVEALIQVHDVPSVALPHHRAMNLPALTVSVAEMIEALAKYSGGRTIGRVRHETDQQLQAIVTGWPTYFVSEAATRLGLKPDSGLDCIINDYLTHGTGE